MIKWSVKIVPILPSDKSSSNILYGIIIFMNKNQHSDSFGYLAPEVSELIISPEGILCGSNQFGETTDLQTNILGDIWF